MKYLLLLIPFFCHTLLASNDPARESASIIHPKSESELPAPRDFQGIPSITATDKGRLYASWYAGGKDEGPENYVLLIHSDNKGTTWSAIDLVVSHPHNKIRTFDPVLWTDPHGTIHLYYAQAYGHWDGRAGLWEITCNDPDAAIPSWTPPRFIADGVMMNKPTVLSDGRWLLPIAMWKQEPRKYKEDHERAIRNVPKQYNFYNPLNAGTQLYASTDQGKTYQRLMSLSQDDIRFDEHMLIEKQNHSLWLLIRAKRGIQEALSSDGGNTWTRPAYSKIPHIDSRFFIRRLDSGRLLLIRHQTPQESGLQRKRVNGRLQSDRSHLSAYLSDNDGASWQGPLLIDSRREVSYPDAVQLPDHSIALVYDYSRKLHKEILFTRFREEDILNANTSLPSPRVINSP